MLPALLLSYCAAAIVVVPMVVEGACGGTFLAEQGVVKSPRYPKKYPHNSNCVYNILASSDATLKLTCTKMNIQKSIGCTKDSLRINGVSFCGRNPPRSIFAKGQIRLEFVTDGSKNKKRGFRCLYERVEGDAYSPESCDSRLSEKSSWNAGWNGQVNIPVDSDITSWTVDFEFTSPVTSFEQWTGVTTALSSTRFSVSKANGPMSAGQTLSFEILYRFAEQTPVPTIKLILLNGKNVCTGEAITTTTPQPTEVTTVTEAPYTGPGCALEGSSYNYDEVLHKSLLFYEAQRSGYLPSSQRVTWRKDSATDDAIDDDTRQRVDLEGGYYDAGDYVKFGYPMAGMTTVLAWGAIEYGEAYTAAGEMAYMKEAVKWASDYFIKAHPEANVFYGQVGDGDVDHAYWGRPEDMTMYRPAFKLTTSKPGSDLAGETAAALAATSILFKDSDPSYAATCLQHAEDLYNFANQYQGKYAQSITDAASFYNSWGVFEDELAWAAAWLYRATNNRDYLSDAKSHYDKLSKSVSEFSWAEKTPGVQVLLSEYADEADRSTYTSDLKSFCDKMVYSMPRTPKKLVFINEWGSLRYAANVAFICLRAADLGISPSIYRQFGKEQIHYMLGDAGRSFVVGFGHNPPQRPHHASSSCPLAPAPCGWSDFSSTEPNVHELTGALVGGPDASDNYVDRRDDYKSNEVTTDYNAGFQSAVAALRVLANCGNITTITVYTSTNPESTNPGETTDSQSTNPETVASTTSKPTVITTPGTGSCESVLQTLNSWNTGWNGKVSIPISTAITSWTVDFIFTSPVTSFEQWTGTTTPHSNTRFSVTKDNAQLPSGSVLSFDFLYRYNEGSVVPSIQSIKLNGQDICDGQDPPISTDAPVTVTTVTQAPYTGPGCGLEGSSYNYDEVLHKSLLFYEAQRSGYLPSSQRVTWRKDSATDDAVDDDTQQRADLEGGYYDAGDYVKFGYPMAGMTTVLAWGAIEYGEAYTAAGEMAYMKEAVKWASDYFIKAHPEANVFYGQVGDGDVDHAYWGRPEDMTMYRPAFKLTTSKPGSDLAGETAAALAATSILFKDSDPSYAATCLQHAEDLYNFANQYQGKYAQSITDAASFYNSWGVFEDELAWAAAWLYRATNNRDYLSDAKSHYDKLSKSVSEFSWAEKTPGVQVLLSEYADEADRSTYTSDLKSFCDKMVYSMPRTPKKLVFINEWGSLRYAANVAFICLRAADLGISPSIYRQFGKEQIHYMLGDAGRSFVVGFGHNPPQRPHHASSSCPLAPAPCGWNDFSSTEPNVHELTGALVGGPDASDNYVDRRDDYKSNEVTTDYNAGFQSAVAALRVLANCGNSTTITVYTPTNPESTNPGETTDSQSTNPETVVPTTQQPTVVTSEGTLSPTSANPESTNPNETTESQSTTQETLVSTTNNPTVVTTEGTSSCESILQVSSSWNTGWNGKVNIPITTTITSWTVEFVFTSPVTSFEQWTGTTTAHSNTRFSVTKDSAQLSPGSILAFDFLYRYNEGPAVPSIRSIKLNGQYICDNNDALFSTDAPVTVTTVTQAPYTGQGCALEGSSYNYDEVLHKSLLFYEAQRSGYLPSSQRVTWRKDSATDDAIDDDTRQRVDLEGGYYDAGDYVKFGYPMAGMTTVLAWGAIEYGEAYTAAGEMAYMKEAVKWASDYFIKAHPEANVFYGQVGDGDVDHAYWGRPEDMTMYRPAFKLTTSKPGSDLAGETAAALAATSILFKDSDPSYAATCLQHAEDLYNFANQYQGKYAQSITDAASFYNSWGVFEDELAWAAAWLYRATNNRDYLSDAKSHYDKLSKSVSEFSWAEKTPGVQVLLSEYADEADRSTYTSDLKSFCDKMVYSMPRTPKKLVFINEWGSLRYAANVAFICLRAADLGISPSIYRQFGKEQIHYMLGDAGRSFVVGFGHNPPQRPHHASSSCPLAPAPCGWNDFSSTEPNVHELTGALVGGPDASDNYVDRRDDYKSNEVTTDYNAGFQSAVAALRVLANCGNITTITVYTSTNPESTNPGETTDSQSTNPETVVPTTQIPTVVTSEGTLPPTSANPESTNPNETTDSQSTTQETLVSTTNNPTVVTTEGTSSCENILQVSSSWNTGWNGKVNIPITTTITSWTVEFVFTSPVTSFEQWTGTTTAHSNTRFSVTKDSAQLSPGSILAFDFLYRYNEGPAVPSIKSIKLNGQFICDNNDALFSTDAPVTVTTVTQAPYTGPGCALEGSSYNYDEVLHKSLLFYEAQRSGYLPSSQRVTWRKDSATDDAIDDDTRQRVDLEGGYYDAGDYVKFGYPMAGMTTVLAWGAIEYGEAYTAAGEMAYMKEAVKWASDYFIKAHPEANVFYGQVGDGDVDHAYWGRPEDMTMYRPAFKLTTSKPGSDLAGETAAALAATSILFKDSDPSYAATCQQHAEDLYNFANQYQGKYAQSITDAASFYNSWGVFEDELAWAAAWLYRATNNRDYLSDAKSHYNKLSKSVSEFSWAEKIPGVQVLLSEYADEADRSTYTSDLKSFCDKMVYSMPRTPKKLVFINEWGSLRYAANVAFICLRAADLGISPSIYRQFGKEQIHYMLGDAGRSFVVGFGHNPPQRPHHASSSCPLAPAPCGWSDFSSTEPNVHELTGALVGGPDASDNYVDRRDDYKSNEVTTDYNAGFQSAVAALRVLANCGNITTITVYTSTNPESTNPGETTDSQSTNPETVVSTTQQPTVVTSEGTLSPTSANPEITESANPNETTDVHSTNPVTVVPTTHEPTQVTSGGISSCESLLQVVSSWNTGWNGKVSIPISSAITSWTVEFEFTAPLTSFEQWTGTTTWLSDTRFSVTKNNTQLSSSSTLSFDFLYRFAEGSVVPVIASIKFNGDTICIRETTTTTLPVGGYACTSVKLLNEWTGNYQLDVSVTFPVTVSSWTIVLTFSDTVDHVEAYTAIETASGNTATLVNESYNGRQTAGQTLVLGMQVSYSGSNRPAVTAIEMNGIELCIE